MAKTDLFDVHFSQGAEEDIETIHEYVAVHGSIEAADRLIERLYDRVDALERFPLRGSILRELDGQGPLNILQSVAAPYRLFYHVADRFVTVLVVVDGRRDVQAVLRQRLLTPPGSLR